MSQWILGTQSLMLSDAQLVIEQDLHALDSRQLARQACGPVEIILRVVAAGNQGYAEADASARLVKAADVLDDQAV